MSDVRSGAPMDPAVAEFVCRTCGRGLAPNADRCPHCNTPRLGSASWEATRTFEDAEASVTRWRRFGASIIMSLAQMLLRRHESGNDGRGSRQEVTDRTS